MNNHYEHGQSAAKIALRILSGVPLADIEIQDKAKYSPFFDYSQLQRFNIDFTRLPADSTVIGRPVTFYEQYKNMIFAALSLVVFLIIVICVLLINIRQRIKAQMHLSKLSLGLESTVQQRTKDLDDRNKELEAASNKMHKLAHTDILTELPNRRAGTKDLKAYIQRYNVDFQPLSVAILDIDHFKKVNNTFGNSVGDKVLSVISQTLKTTLRPSDRVYRWGGEEFLIALPDT